MLNLKEDLELLTNVSVNNESILPLVYLLIKDSEHKEDVKSYSQFYKGVKKDVKVQVTDNNAVRLRSQRPSFESWLAGKVQS